MNDMVSVLASSTLSSPERLENYRRENGIPYLGHENGWNLWHLVHGQ
jgi:hypothetical protein